SSSMMPAFYPSPTDGTFYFDIDVDSERDVIVEVYDVTGKLLLQNVHPLNAGITTVKENIGELTKGVYLVRVVDSTSNNYYSNTIVKE
ncbi:MAG TPA: T9SS type A sorting domain-containing protein, partial [Bacteroidia bacterium]